MQLTFDQTVPRALAHRHGIGEVFIADSAQTSDTEFVLAVQVPRAHSLWFDRRVPYHDPLSTCEAARQAAFVVVHRHIGLPFGVPFSLHRLELRVESLDAYRDNETSPLQGMLTMRLVEQTRRGEALGAMSFAGELLVDDELALTLGGDIVFLPREDYAALREFHRSRRPAGAPEAARVRPVAGAQVGRFDERNVVIGHVDGAAAGGETARYALIADERHPSFFDHPYDHAPGPLIVEAYRQAAIATALGCGALDCADVAVTGLEASFTNFGELDAPIECTATVGAEPAGGSVEVALALSQFGGEIATGRVQLSPYP